MSRSARQWNDHRAHIKLLEGDLNECHRWYGLALIRLKFLLEHQPGSVTDAMIPVEGVYIRVDTRPNRIHIKVAQDGIYLESGFLDLLSSGQCAENTYLPAILRFNSVVSTYMATLQYPLQGKLQFKQFDPPLLFGGEKLINGQDSLSVGCAGKLDSITLADPCSATYSNGGYCDPAKILMKKKCQALIPSSLYSGKMRLFVQALYGSKRDDYSCEWSRPGFDYTLKLNGHSLSGFSNGNSGIVTTEDYQYFLFQVGTEGLVYYPLQLEDSVAPLKQYLIDNPSALDETKRKIEAYILSTATLEELNLDTGISVPFTATVGVTLANCGWAWSWDGIQADVIKHEPNNTTQNYTARHYRLTITPTLTDGIWSFSASVATISTSDWWPMDGKINIIYPKYNTADTQMLPLLGPIPYKHIKGSLTGSGTSSYNAKVFCFRDDNDVLQIVSVNYSVRFSATNINESEPTPTEAGIPYIYQHTRNVGTLGIYLGTFNLVVGSLASYSTEIEYSANLTYIEKQLAGDPVYYGFTYAGSNNNYFPYPGASLVLNARAANGIPYSGDTLQVWMVNNGYWVNSSQSVIAGYRDRGDGVQTEIYYGADIYLQWYRWYQQTSINTDLNPSLFFEIPYGSFNSVFAGKYSYDKSSDTTIRSSDPLPITSRPWSPHHWEVITYYYNQFGQIVRIGTIGVSQICSMMFYDVTGQVVDTWTGNRNLKQQNVYYHDDHGNTAIVDASSQTTVDQSQNWHFEGQVLTPLLGTVEPSRTSFSGSKYTITFGSNPAGEFDFPADSAVGWA